MPDTLEHCISLSHLILTITLQGKKYESSDFQMKKVKLNSLHK